jgi:hypothetical protein
MQGGTRTATVGGTKTLFSQMSGGRGLPLYRQTFARGATSYNRHSHSATTASFASVYGEDWEVVDGYSHWTCSDRTLAPSADNVDACNAPCAWDTGSSKCTRVDIGSGPSSWSVH